MVRIYVLICTLLCSIVSSMSAMELERVSPHDSRSNSPGKYSPVQMYLPDEPPKSRRGSADLSSSIDLRRALASLKIESNDPRRRCISSPRQSNNPSPAAGPSTPQGTFLSSFGEQVVIWPVGKSKSLGIGLEQKTVRAFQRSELSASYDGIPLGAATLTYTLDHNKKTCTVDGFTDDRIDEYVDVEVREDAKKELPELFAAHLKDLAKRLGYTVELIK